MEAKTLDVTFLPAISTFAQCASFSCESEREAQLNPRLLTSFYSPTCRKFVHQGPIEKEAFFCSFFHCCIGVPHLGVPQLWNLSTPNVVS